MDIRYMKCCKREVLLIEYQKAQDSAQHHDTLVWTITSLNWIGSAILMGFVIEKIGTHINVYLKTALLSISIVGITLSLCVWLWSRRTREVKVAKYKRCKVIEGILGMEQHSKLEYKGGSQTTEYAALMLLFLAAWVVLIVMVVTAPS